MKLNGYKYVIFLLFLVMGLFFFGGIVYNKVFIIRNENSKKNRYVTLQNSTDIPINYETSLGKYFVPKNEGLVIKMSQDIPSPFIVIARDSRNGQFLDSGGRGGTIGGMVVPILGLSVELEKKSGVFKMNIKDTVPYVFEGKKEGVSQPLQFFTNEDSSPYEGK